jgi:hypothetical protein
MDERVAKALIDVAELVKAGQQSAAALESAWGGVEELTTALGVLATQCAALDKRLQAVEAKLEN